MTFKIFKSTKELWNYFKNQKMYEKARDLVISLIRATGLIVKNLSLDQDNKIINIFIEPHNTIGHIIKDIYLIEIKYGEDTYVKLSNNKYEWAEFDVGSLETFVKSLHKKQNETAEMLKGIHLI